MCKYLFIVMLWPSHKKLLFLPLILLFLFCFCLVNSQAMMSLLLLFHKYETSRAFVNRTPNWQF